jgi:mannose-1-phosphate guanylyltransferase
MYEGVPGNMPEGNDNPGFAAAAADSKRLWSIVLAGGNGDRIRELTQHWMGRPVPKQYCAFVGRRSMLQHTLLRADKLGQRDRQFILIADSHQKEAAPQLKDRDVKSILVQPANRDTLPGIFLPLTHVYARDAEATVVIHPSDHFIYPEKSFVRAVEHAVRAVEELPHLVILIGVPADRPEPEYGWICPDKQVWKSAGFSVRSVSRFLEKPSHALAAAAMEGGGLWNTLILAAKAETLWELGWIYAPEILRHFQRLYNTIGTHWEEETLQAIYDVMPSRNFSSGLLEPAAGRIGVLPMENVLWSDWGRKERIIETLRRIGKRPNFSMIPAAGSRPAAPKQEDIFAAS